MDVETLIVLQYKLAYTLYNVVFLEVTLNHWKSCGNIVIHDQRAH